MGTWRKLSLVVAIFVLLLCFSRSSATVRRRVDCQKYVFAPVCRGSTAKRDIGGAREEADFFRYPSQMDDYAAFQPDSIKPVNVVDARSILTALLKAAAARSADYDASMSNYGSL